MRLRRLLLAGVVAIMPACSKAAPEEVESETVVPVTTATAQTGTITAHVRATGLVTAQPGAEQIIVAPEAARIVELPKAEGDVVRRGDLLVRFEIPSTAAEASKQRSEITRAQARVTAAEAALSRTRDLFDRGVAAGKDVEAATKEIADAHADLAGARAAASAADAIAGRSIVRANFSGIVVKRSHNPGDLVDANATDPILRVVDPSRLEVVAQIPLADAPRIHLGAAAHLADAPSSAPLRVAAHPGAVDAGSPTVPIRLKFPSNGDYPVGMPVQVIIDAESHANAVVVPAAAIVREGETTAVFVAAGDKAQRRDVTVGAEDEDRVEITSGVKAGEMVITSNHNGLPDGAAISIAPAATTPPPKGES